VQFLVRIAPFVLLVPLGSAGLAWQDGAGARSAPQDLVQRRAYEGLLERGLLDAPLLADVDAVAARAHVAEASARFPLWRLDERHDALLRLAAPIPPGLSATRAKERRTQRTAELAELVALLGPRVLPTLDELLADPNTPEDLWFAAAAAVGDLDLTRLAPRLAACLDQAEPGSRRAAAARRALYTLYGVWFQDAREVQELVLVEGAALVAYREHLRLLEERLIAELPRVWAVDTASAIAALDDRSPRVRGAAARALATAVNTSLLDPTLVADTLLAHAREEGDGVALSHLLDSLGLAMQGRLPTDERVVALRAQLADGVRGGPRSAQHLFTRALAALPFESTRANVPESAAAGLRLVVLSLERVVEGAYVDSDVAIGVLQSLRSLAKTYDARALELGAELTAPLLTLLERGGASRDVRIAAAGAIGELGGGPEFRRVAERLASASDVAEALAIVSALEALLAFASEQDLEHAAATLVAGLRVHCASEDSEVRRRSLALLAALGARPGTRLDVEFLVPRLSSEPLPELRLAALDLVRRHGGADAFDRMLELGVLRRVAVELPNGPQLVADLVAVLPASDSSRRLGAARELAGVGGAELGAATLARALELGVAAIRAAGRSAEPGECADVVAWALDLRRSHGPLTFEAPLPDGTRAAPLVARALVAQIVEDVLPRAALADAVAGRARALLSADAGLPVPEIDAAFTAARAALVEGDAPAAERFDLAREYARFLVRIDARDAARERFREIAASAGGAAWLGVAGLREYLELLPLGEPVDPRRALDRTGVLLALVELDAWRELASAVRVRDAIDLCTSAQASKDLGAQRRAVAARPTFGLPTGGDDPSWADHEAIAAELGRLIDLYAAIDAFVDARADVVLDESNPSDAGAPGPGRVPPQQGPTVDGPRAGGR
jgi:hypothetical protein